MESSISHDPKTSSACSNGAIQGTKWTILDRENAGPGPFGLNVFSFIACFLR